MRASIIRLLSGLSYFCTFGGCYLDSSAASAPNAIAKTVVVGSLITKKKEFS